MTVLSRDIAPEEAPRECTSCGERFPLYGDRYLCWLCLQGASGNHGDPNLTAYFSQDGES